MKNLTKLMILAATLSCLTACGGGGGSDQVGPDYSGAWTGYVDLVSNTCPRQIPDEFQYIYLLHNVDQGTSEDALGNQILDLVLSDGTDTYVGVGELEAPLGNGDTFSVTGSSHELPGFLNNYRCIEVIDFNYDAIKFEDKAAVGYQAFAGFVTRHSSITCTKGSEVKTCDVTYVGTATNY